MAEPGLTFLEGIGGVSSGFSPTVLRWRCAWRGRARQKNEVPQQCHMPRKLIPAVTASSAVLPKACRQIAPKLPRGYPNLCRSSAPGATSLDDLRTSVRQLWGDCGPRRGDNARPTTARRLSENFALSANLGHSKEVAVTPGRDPDDPGLHAKGQRRWRQISPKLRAWSAHFSMKFLVIPGPDFRPWVGQFCCCPMHGAVLWCGFCSVLRTACLQDRRRAKQIPEFLYDAYFRHVSSRLTNCPVVRRTAEEGSSRRCPS